MFSFTVNKNEIIMTESETITSGSVNAYECKFEFSEDWAGLSKTVTFRAGYVKISVILDNTNTCSIPWEVLEKDAVQLYCGVRGTVTAYDEEEDAIIPTVYCLLGTIRKGTELGDNAAPPEPSVVDQIMNRIEALDTGKQDKLHGKAGQVVGFDADGNAVAQDNKSPEYTAGDNISISDGVISAKNSTYSIVKDEEPETPGAIAEYHLVDNTKADDVVIVGDSIAIPDMRYDDTEIRSDIESVSALTDEVAATAAANTEAISAINDSVASINTKLNNKQDKLTAGDNISISDNVISADMYDDTAIKSDIAKLDSNKQNKLTAGDNVHIENNVISADMYDDTEILADIAKLDADKQNKLTAGDNISIENNVISANTYDDTELRAGIAKLGTDKQDKLHGTAGQVVGFDADGNAVAQGGASPVYTAGENIHISEDNVISADMYDDTEIRADISKLDADKQNKLTAGDNVHISEDNVISADTYDDTAVLESIAKLGTDKQDKLHGVAGQVVGFDESGNAVAQSNTSAVYTAGDNIHISEDNVISADMYDDTEIRSDISDISALTDEISAATAANTGAISSINDSVADINTKLGNKQDKLTAGDNIRIENNVISAAMYDDTEIRSDIANLGNKQDKLTAGDNISIENNVISAAMYDDTGIKSSITKLNTNKQDKLTAGDNISIENNVISAAMYDDIGIKSDISKLNTNKQDKLTAGDNVHISGNVISADMYDDTAVLADIAKLNTGKQNKLSGAAGQVVGFDANGNAIAQDGGADGVTFTPSVSSSGVISWANDGGRENPASVNIKGPAGSSAGFGTVTATVTNTTGTPSVTVTTSGSNTAKNFDFAFSGLKGESADPASVPAYSVTYVSGSASSGIVDTTYVLTKDGKSVGTNIVTKKSGAHLFDGQGYRKGATPYGTALTVSSSSSVTSKLNTEMMFEEYYADTDYVASTGYCVTDFNVFSNNTAGGLIVYMKSSSNVTADISYIEIPLSIQLNTNSDMSVRKLFTLTSTSNRFSVYIGSTTSYVSTNHVYFEGLIRSNSSNYYQILRLTPLLPYGGSIKVSLYTYDSGFTLIPIS